MRVTSSKIIIITIFCTVNILLGQDRKLVIVSPQVGEEMDRQERDRYGFFPLIDNFISARFYRLTDDTYEIEIKSFEDGNIKEQIWYLSRQEFIENYMKVINPRLSQRERRRTRHREQLLKIYCKEDEQFVGKITEVGEDFIRLAIANSETDLNANSSKLIAISEIKQIAIVRSTNIPTHVGIGIAPGVVLGILGFLSGNDRNAGIFKPNFTAEEKAKFLFFSGSIVGLSITGTMAAIRSIDRDLPFYDQTIEGKRNILDQYYNNKIRRRSTVRFGPWFGLYYFPSDLKDLAYLPGARMSICFLPRLRMEIVYGFTEWFGKEHHKLISDYNYNDSSPNTRWEKLRIHHFRIGLRTDFTYLKKVNPFFTWGWGLLNKTYQSDEVNEEIDFILSCEAGIEHHISDWFSLESRLGLVENFNHGIQLTGQIGLHIGKFY